MGVASGHALPAHRLGAGGPGAPRGLSRWGPGASVLGRGGVSHASTSVLSETALALLLAPFPPRTGREPRRGWELHHIYTSE